MATTQTHLKTRTHTQTHQQSSKQQQPKRRSTKTTTINNNRKITTTITTSATTLPPSDHPQRKRDTPIVVSPPENPWCCSALTKQEKLIVPEQEKQTIVVKEPPLARSSVSSASSSFKVTFSPGRVSPIMDTVSSVAESVRKSVATSSPSRFGVANSVNGGNVIANVIANGGNASGMNGYGYTKFNSALNAGLLPVAMSPPPINDKVRSSPTLYEMMSSEHDCSFRNQLGQTPMGQMVSAKAGVVVVSVQDKQVMLRQRVADMLGNCSPGSKFNDEMSSDVKLSLSSKEGLSVSMNVHRSVLVGNSKFFAGKLTDGWVKQQRSLPHIVEILDCDDVEVYIETLRLMYCKDLRRRLMKEDVSKVLGILKVSAAIIFEAGVLSCLEYLEAVPWAEDEEDKVASLLSQLHLQGNGAGEVLRRVSVEVAEEREEGSSNEDVLLKLLQVVLEGKDEKARREMKGLMSKMLRENSSSNDLSKESLYSSCDGCLQLLRLHFLNAASSDLQHVSQIARQADNLHWILDIMIDRQMAEDFLKTWAEQIDLSEVHSTVPAIYRYEISRVTARLFVAIGKGQLVASKEVRCLLIQTWLEPFYEDFGWMRRASKGLDRHLIEDGLSNTILTLPLANQQDILLSWFDRFLNSGEDCPNIQRGFQVWWRRAFWKRNGESERPR